VNEKIQSVLIARAELKNLGITVANSTLLRWEELGLFPRRLRLGGTTVAWPYDEVLAWIERLKAERKNHVYADAK